jgi:hypothetical protein
MLDDDNDGGEIDGQLRKHDPQGSNAAGGGPGHDDVSIHLRLLQSRCDNSRFSFSIRTVHFKDNLLFDHHPAVPELA